VLALYLGVLALYLGVLALYLGVLALYQSAHGYARYIHKFMGYGRYMDNDVYVDPYA